MKFDGNNYLNVFKWFTKMCVITSDPFTIKLQMHFVILRFKWHLIQ